MNYERFYIQLHFYRHCNKNIKIFDRVAERKRISIIISLMLLPPKLCSDYAHHVQCFQLKSEYVVQSLVINYTV
jgi:hypothetical protein